MANGPGMPLRRDTEQIRAELKRLREQHPRDYAAASAPLLAEIERAERARRQYALT